MTDDVDRVELSDGGVQRVYLGDEEHLAKTVILAMGAEPRRLGVPGEVELAGRGVSYCATCDGAFFQTGGGRDRRRRHGDGGGDVRLQVRQRADRGQPPRGVPRLEDHVRAGQGAAQRQLQTPFVAEEFVAGEDGKLDHVRLRNAETGETEDVDTDGAFIAIGHNPNSHLVEGQVGPTRGLHRYRAAFHPDQRPGVFAVGDVADHIYRQAVTAAGTGCMAALDAEAYLRDTPIDPEAHWVPGGEPAEVAPTSGS